MEKSELYENQFPLEDVLPTLGYFEARDILKENGFRKPIESDTDLIRLGYEYAQERIEKILKPVKE